MNAEELKSRALALTHTAIAMRVRAEDPTCAVLSRSPVECWQPTEQPLWRSIRNYCLAALQQGRVDWTRPVWFNGQEATLIDFCKLSEVVWFRLPNRYLHSRHLSDHYFTNDPPKPEPVLDLTKPIRQRGGRKVRNVAESGVPAYPITADCECHDGTWEKRSFCGNGLYCSNRSDWDLVNYVPQCRDLNDDELAELVGTAVWWTNDVNKRMRTLITSHDAREVRVWLSNRWVSAAWLRTNATHDREGKLPVAQEAT